MSKYPSAALKTRSAKPAAVSSMSSVLRCHVRGRDPAVHDQRGSGHEARIVAREEEGGLREFLRSPEAAHRDVREPALLLPLVGEEGEEQRGLDRARTQGVAPDASARVLDGDLAR